MELPAHHWDTWWWLEFQAALRRHLGDLVYTLWIEPLRLRSLEGQTLILEAPPETESWLENRYGRLLRRCAQAVLGPDARVQFAGRQPYAQAEFDCRPEVALHRLNPRFTFDQFIIGDGNRLAHAAALAVAELPGQTYNPLFLHAAPGLGKTHLLHAIGNYVLAYGGGAKVRYTTVEAFTNHFIRSLGTRSLDAFKQVYREADVLLIDDVQFLASKAKTEEEFFHTFNALYDHGRQLVVTCDRLPSQLEGIADRLRERFQAGLVADISPPDFATRVAILRKRAALDSVPLEQADVLELIAGRVSDNVRALEGALVRVVAFHSLTGQPITVPLAERVLDGLQYPRGARTPGLAPRPAPQAVSIASIQRAVAYRYGVSVDDILSHSRAARVAWPRQLAIHLARELTGASLTMLGSAFGGRNHATILHACKRVAERAATDHQVAVDVAELSRELSHGPGDRFC